MNTKKGFQKTNIAKEKAGIQSLRMSGGKPFNEPHCRDTGIEFSEILRGFLKENDLTQTKFAKIVGIKQSQVSEWLKGKAKPGYDILKEISKSFGISADYFLGLTDGY